MSYAITHFSLGVIGTILLLFATNRYTHRDAPFILFAGGFLGMAPDVLHFVPVLRHESYTAVHNSIFSNIFFAHHFFDTIVDPHDSMVIAGATTTVMAVTLLFFTYIHRKKHSNVNLNHG